MITGERVGVGEGRVFVFEAPASEAAPLPSGSPDIARCRCRANPLRCGRTGGSTCSSPTSEYSALGGLRPDPSCDAGSPTCSRTYGNGSSEMRVLLSTYGSCAEIKPIAGLAVQSPARCANAGVRAAGLHGAVGTCRPAAGADRSLAMTEHAVVVVGAGPTGLMLAGELALAGVDVAIVERRGSQNLAGSRAAGLHSRTIEVFDQRGIAERFLGEGQKAQTAYFAGTRLDTSDFPTRHNYGLGLWQIHIERILA